jgi:hypothetical protein
MGNDASYQKSQNAMDDLITGTLFLMMAAAAVALYIMVAGGAAATLAVAVSVDSVGYSVWRLGSICVRAIRDRGGDRRTPAPPEPAFEIYFGRPFVRDFQAALGVIARELFQTAQERSRWAFGRFEGAMLPLGIGVAVGAYVGAVVGIALGGLIGVLLGVVVFVVGTTVWVGARLLQLFERARRRVRGAHFDCPACGERSGLPNYVCPTCGAKHRQLLPGRWGIRRRRCECNQVLLPTLEITGRHSLPAECPKCTFPMPGAGGIVPELAFPLVGGPKAGKTAFLASLLLELDAQTQAGGTRLAVGPSSRAAFDRYTDGLKSGHVPDKTQIRERTPAFVAEVRAGANRSALLYAHDIAGELYQQADRVRDTPYLVRARGAVLLLDPFSLRPVAAELERERKDQAAAIAPSPENPQHVLERFLQALRESGRTDARKIPLAVVLSKADALGASTDPLSPGASSGDVRAWLERNGAANLVRMLEAELDRCEFFAVSALGRVPNGHDGAFVPEGTLAPFEWLLRTNGVAVGGAAEPARATVSEKLEESAGARAIAPLPTTPLFAPRPYSLPARAAAIAAVLAVGGAATAAGGAFQQGEDPLAFEQASSTTSSSGSSSGASDDTSDTTDYPSEEGDGSFDSRDETDPPRPRAAAPVRLLRKHFRSLDNGNYQAAFRLMSARYRATSPSWPSARADASPSIHIVTTRKPAYGSGTADVFILFYARDSYDTPNSDTQCRRFWGTAHLIRVGGTWRYDPLGNNLQSRVSHSSQCP